MPIRKPDQVDTVSSDRADINGDLDELRRRLVQTTRILSEKNAEISSLADEQQGRKDELAALQVRYDQVARELRERNAVLHQIQGSQGWRLLSVYYRLRAKVIPGRIAKRAAEAVALLRDMRLVSSSGLFDRDWYLQQNPDVAAAKVSPLRHYLRRGALEGRDPNPLFDSDWYLQQYPDTAAAGLNPLVHYLRHGASEGRDPSPLFDTDWYREQYPDRVNAGMNPLAHFLHHGAAEGRIPCADFGRNQYTQQAAAGLSLRPQPSPATGDSGPPNRDNRQPLMSPTGEKRPRIKTRPISGAVKPHGSIAAADRKRLLCVTHVLPYPSRAGNEYRIHRMLDWFASSGFEVFLIVCPLQGYSITSQRLVDACSAHSNLLLCQRDGTVLYHLEEGDALLKGLAGVKPRDFATLLGEDTGDTPVAQRLLPIVRTFCPDALAEVLLHLDSVLEPHVLLLDYVFMTRALPLMRPESFKVVDTIDVFSTKHTKVVPFGIEDSLALTVQEEAGLLKWADLVIAIQGDEAEELRRIVPQKPVITAGIDFCPVEATGFAAPSPVVLMVASDNALNVKGLKDFLRFAWPLVRREVPDAELRVIGAVGLQMEVDDPSVNVLGQVDDLTTAYAEARVVINPAVAGTGLKIKTIEALCHLRPLVTWPSGVDGVEADVRALCYIATDWYMFAQHVVHLCKSEDSSRSLVSRRAEILQRFSADTTYAELKAALSRMHAGFSEPQRATPSV